MQGWLINGTPELEAKSRADAIIGSAMATTALMLVVFAARVYVRTRMVKNFAAEDWCIVVAVIFSLPYTFGGALAQTRYGLGLPFPDYPAPNVRYSKVLNYAFRAFYCVSVTAFKVALCFVYLKVTSGSSAKTYRRLIWSTMAFSIIFLIYYLVIVIFPCTPIHKFWDPTTPGTCLPNPVVYYSPAVVTIVIDLILFFLPVPLVLKLQMSGKRKAGLIAAFMLGLLTTVCSVMRLVGSVNVQTQNDPSDLIIWAIAEMNIGIITTSVPSLAPLLKKTKALISRGSNGTPYNSKPRSGIGHKLSTLVKPSRNKSLTNDTYARGALGRNALGQGDSSEEDILGDNKSTGTQTQIKGERSDSDVEAGRQASFEYNQQHAPRFALPPIVKTTDVDISSAPRTAETDHMALAQSRRLRGI